MSFSEFINYNWALLLVIIAIFVILYTTVQFSKKTALLLFITSLLILLLAIVDYIETYFGNLDTYSIWRSILSAFKYALPSLILSIIGVIAFNFNRKYRWLIFIPAVIHFALCLISIPTGIIFFFYEDNNAFARGPLGYLPFIMSGLYLAYIVFCIVFYGKKNIEDLIPITVMGIYAVCATVLPILWANVFERWFATTIAIAVLMYCIYLLQQLAKADPLTGLLNRQTFYHDSEKKRRRENYKSVFFIDMNGLKIINDSKGHQAGDEAIMNLASAIVHSFPLTDRVYRIGGDEFIVLSKCGNEEVIAKIIEKVKDNFIKYNISASLGYCIKTEEMSFNEAYDAADKMMYIDKEKYHQSLNK